MSNKCKGLRGSITHLAINPFHTDEKVAERVRSHISSCDECHTQYEKDVRDRKELESRGYDPTHQYI